MELSPLPHHANKREGERIGLFHDTGSGCSEESSYGKICVLKPTSGADLPPLQGLGGFLRLMTAIYPIPNGAEW